MLIVLYFLSMVGPLSYLQVENEVFNIVNFRFSVSGDVHSIRNCIILRCGNFLYVLCS